MRNSRISKLYRMSIAERIDELRQRAVLDQPLADALRQTANLLSAERADAMIENVIGVFGLPLAVAPNFTVNDVDYIVPMVVEEPSIVAGVSRAAGLARSAGGFTASSAEPVLVGQIHLAGIDDVGRAIDRINARRSELIELANSLQPKLLERGGGVTDIECFRLHPNDAQTVVLIHVSVDTRDAMGANVVNTICEGIAGTVEEITSGEAVLRILSNLADKSIARASAVFRLDELEAGGASAEAVRDRIVLASQLADVDPYRAATHNKGVMNGVDAVAIATGNDWRAVEAGAHAYAARNGAYRSLTRWCVDDAGDLRGEIAMPIKVGIVGGSLKTNRCALAGLQISGVRSASELARLMAAVGLAQNFAALHALASDGIQKGHMSLHARNLAAAAGATGAQLGRVVERLIQSGEIKDWKAREIVAELTDASAARERRDTPAGIGTAAGKIILLGEHAAVYDKHVLAVPISSAVTATVHEAGSGVSLRVPDWEISQVVTAGSRDGAAAVVRKILEAMGVDGRDFEILVRSRIPMAMGLGSSAAFAAAIIRAIDDLLALDMDDDAVNEISFECEKISHGEPSGIDNTLAVYSHPVLYKKNGDPPVQKLHLSGELPLVIACSSARGMTKNQVAMVRSRYEQYTELHERLFAQIDEISVAGAAALSDGSYEHLGMLMNVCHGLLNALQVSTPELEEMVQIARSHAAIGAKLTGAGGGGSVVALCPGHTRSVAGAFRDAGYRIIE